MLNFLIHSYNVRTDSPPSQANLKYLEWTISFSVLFTVFFLLGNDFVRDRSVNGDCVVVSGEEVEVVGRLVSATSELTVVFNRSGYLIFPERNFALQLTSKTKCEFE